MKSEMFKKAITGFICYQVKNGNYTTTVEAGAPSSD